MAPEKQGIFDLICAFVGSSHVSGLFTRFWSLALIGSADQVSYSLAGFDARDIRRGVLVLSANLCTIISRVLLTRCFCSSQAVCG